mgnify:CR=1 FL=1
MLCHAAISPSYPKLPAVHPPPRLRDRCRFGLLAMFTLTTVSALGLALARHAALVGTATALVAWLPAAAAINACLVVYFGLRSEA